MSERTHALAQLLAGKETIEDCSLDEIKKLVQRYPYFAPAQFLLLQKLKQDSSPDYSAHLQKAILYYPNPLSFQYFISSSRFYTELPPEVTLPSPEESAETVTDENPPVFPDDTSREDEQPEAAASESTAGQAGTELTSAAQPAVSEPAMEEPVPVTEPEPQDSGVQEPAPPPADRQEPSVTLAAEPVPPAVPPGDTGITFEPFHTVDYFASQGIKLSAEEVPKDKFGKQLKSFTEWLKTMKRIPPGQVNETMDSNTEHRVQRLAQHSIDESAVWTEAMAEVWIKQGNHQKAIDVYHKLSLLNPSKKAYFADKIENLKRS